MSTKKQRGSGARAAVPASGADGRSSTGRTFRQAARSRTALVGGVTLGITGAVLSGLPAAQAIDSNPPTGPGNVEIFTKRDMVAIEGYSEYAGKEALIKVFRGPEGAKTVVGSARGTVDGTGFLEVNHPGGVCWGAGTGLNVTPDIRGGDEIRVDFQNTGGKWDGATVQDVQIDEVLHNETQFTLTLNGSYGPEVDMPTVDDLTADPGRFGIEIVNPDMRGGTSNIGERAIGWPVEVGEATVGYAVTGSVTGTDIDSDDPTTLDVLESTGGTFSVTYDFETLSDLELARAGEHVALAWQADHSDPNQEAQFGLTMWENGESAGPGFGGCPAGPDGALPVAPAEVSGKGAGPGAIEVNWGAGSVAPGSGDEITGYSVTAIRSLGDGTEAGGVVRVDEVARAATVQGLDTGEVYEVEVATQTEAGESKPSIMRIRAASHVDPTAKAQTARRPNEEGQYAPLVTTANGDFGVHLDPVLGLVDAEVHYTLDGSTPTLSSPTFVSGVDESLQILQDTTVKWIVVDGGNIVGPEGSEFFDIVEADKAAPTISTVAVGPVGGTVDVTFNRLSDPEVAAYRVQAYDATSGTRVGSPVGIAQTADTGAEGQTVTRRVTGLTDGTSYKFTVAARYGTEWSAESTLSDPIAPEGTPRADAGEPQTVLRGRQFTLDGSGSARALSHTWTQIRPGPANNGGLPQDPAVDLNPGMTGTQTSVSAVSTTGRFPLLSTLTSDHNLLFRLTTTHSDGQGGTFVRNATVEIKGQADAVTAASVRWRAGDEIGGTGSQENAQLSLHQVNLDGTVGQRIAQVFVTNGEWTLAAGTPALPNNRLFIWSDYGFTGTITTTD